MASFDPNTLANTLVSRGGYNPTDAANAARGARAQELAREFGVVPGGQSQQFNSANNAPQRNTYSQDNVNNTIKQAREQFQQAIAPTVQNLQSQANIIPQQIQQQTEAYQGQISRLEKRYQDLIGSIKGQGQQQVDRQTLATRNEVGRRGVPLSSGVAEQAVVDATNPINANTGGLLAQTGFSQEEALANIGNAMNALPLQQQQQQLAIQQAIAQLQGGADQNAIQTAMQILNSQQSTNQFNQGFDFQSQQYNDQLAKENVLFPLEVQQLKNQLAQQQKAVALAPTLQDLFSMVNGASTPKEPKPTVKPKIQSTAPMMSRAPIMSVPR